jgi:sugar phosphate isomerase/epimerase
MTTVPIRHWSRRAFLEAGLLSSATWLIGATSKPSGRTKFSLRYVLASSMYGNLPLSVVLAEAAKTPTRSVDLWARIHGTQREEAEALGPERLRALLEEHKVNIPVTTRYDLGPFKLASEIAFLRGLGGKIIVVGPKGPSGLTGGDLRRELRRFVELLKPQVDLAIGAGITIAIENHGDTLIASPDAIRWLIEFSQELPLGIALAPYHLPQDPELIGQLIHDLGSKLTLFYAWQYGMGCAKPMPKNEELMQLPGRGNLDFFPIVRALHTIEYKGWIEILMHPTPRGFPILDTAQAVTAEINQATIYLDQISASI